MQKALKSNVKIIAGGLIWLIAIVGIGWLVRAGFSKNSVDDRLVNYLRTSPESIELYSNNYQLLGFGDPIFVIADGKATLVGKIAYIDFGEGYEEFRLGDTKSAIATFYGNAPEIEAGDYLKVHEMDQSIDWVVQTMLPPEMRLKIISLISDAWTFHQDELIAMFRPLIEESFAEAATIIQQDLQTSIENHRAEINTIANQYQEQMLDKEIVPLIREEIWPMVREEVQPLAESIGQEIWNEVSVWRFGWRYIYDRSPLPDKRLTEKEFKRFVDRKAVPILEGHLEDFIDIQKRLISRIADNQRVKETVTQSVQKIANDPEFQQLVGTIIREVLVENPRLRDALRKKWESPQARRAIERANRKLDPTVIDIGATLFGSTRTAITPEFAKVLRNKVLHKDKRWLTLHSAAYDNRDEAYAQNVISSASADKNEAGLRRLPMFIEIEEHEFPLSAAPPIEQKVRTVKPEK